HLIRVEPVSVGTANECIAHPREIFRAAITYSAYAVIVVHIIRRGIRRPARRITILRDAWPARPNCSKLPCSITSSSARRRRGTPVTLVSRRPACCETAPGSETSGSTARQRARVCGLAMSGPKIHPTAIVDPRAKIGDGAEIGPFSLIGSGESIGEKTVIQSHVVIEGETRIGSGNWIGHGAVIGAPPQDISFKRNRKTRVEIGDGNIIREFCTIHRGTAEGSATEIGHGNFLMAGAHIGHNCSVGNGVIIANNRLLGGYV